MTRAARVALVSNAILVGLGLYGWIGARFFGMSERFWLNLQSHYDLETERDRLGASLQKEVQTMANAD